MLHELLLALSGIPGSLFRDNPKNREIEVWQINLSQSTHLSLFLNYKFHRFHNNTTKHKYIMSPYNYFINNY